ncbi:major facilitator superfamily domain-containing protein 12-like [Chrysoperla carnea]|uniref:major facilitator superfamily domain-containing protein 12-like n=1 Tax=Chrysoperla carnea TaxID=189513 RepID=UPI001D092A59|nr:major facilitator superfamily domain-containing protein 12-like [Chrysoperla carnea]
MAQISHLSMIPDIPGPDHQRTELTTIRYTVSVLASVCFYLIAWMVIHFRDGNKKTVGPSDRYKFMDIALIVTFLGATCSVLFYMGMKRYRESSVQNRRHDEILTVPKVCQIFASPIIYQVSMLYVASRLLLTINLIYMPLFLDERQAYLPPNSVASQQASADDLAGVPLISYVSSFATSLGLKYFVLRFGNKCAYFMGCVIGFIGCIWIQMLQSDSNYAHIYFSAILLGAGSAITLVTSLSLTADFIGTNTEQGAFVYSLVTFADKMLTGVAVLIIEHLKCESQELCPEYYHHTFVYACGGSCLLGCIILATLVPTTKI